MTHLDGSQEHPPPPVKTSWRDRTIESFLTQPVRYIIGGVVLIMVIAFLASCGSKAAEPFQDADRGTTNDAPADTITFPDGFSNVATKCDHGNRVYVIFKGNSPYGSVAVVPDDPSCP